MKDLARRRLALVVALGLVVVLALPVGATAAGKPAKPAGVRPQVYVPADAYENDDTAAEAKVLPPISIHTFSSSATKADEDWSVISADETGTPFVIETQSVSGWFDGELEIYSKDASGNLVAVPGAADDDSETWDWSYGSTLYFSAPAPGEYFVKSAPSGNDTEQAGVYTMFESKGIARRIAGTDRFETAAKVSKTLWPETNNALFGTGEGPDGIIIANGYKFPDALAGSALSVMGQGSQKNMPILIVGQDFVPDFTAGEFARLVQTNNWDVDQMKIFVLGDQNSVSDEVVEDLMELGEMPFRAQDAIRLAGADRYATAAKVASEAVTEFGEPDTVFLTTGERFADGLAAAPVAGAAEAPVLYSKLTTIGPATSKWLLEHPSVTKAVVLGDDNSIDAAVASALATAPYSLDVTRVAGPNRFATARKIAEFGIDEYDLKPSILLVNGYSFPDALCSGTLSGNTGSVVLLTPADRLASQVTSFFDEYRDDILPDVSDAAAGTPNYVFGGTPSVSEETFEAFTNLYERFE